MRRKPTRREKNETLNRRFEIIKNLMSSFVVGTAAIVAAVVFIPKSPQAEIIKTKALIDTITYQVEVTDEDNALDLSTLVVVLENQFEYYETSINLGESSGYFDSLQPNTEYWLNIYGSKGFGQERLDSKMIRTRDSVGATILSVDVIQHDIDTSYMVDVLVSDPDQIYQTVTLYYGYVLEWEPDQPIQYTPIDIVSSHEQIELMNIFTEEPFHIYIEGTTVDGSLILDDIWITPPFELYSAMYVDRINDDAIYFNLYSDMREGLDPTYQINAYRGEILIRSIDVDIGENDNHDITTGLTGLSPGKSYVIEGVATFTNPLTKRRERVVIYQEDITTLEQYDINYDISPMDDYLEVTITVTDPNHYFQIPSYDLYEIIDGQEVWISSEDFEFIPIGHDKTVTFMVYPPFDTHYRLVISIANQIDFTMRHVIYDEINE